MYCEKAFFLVFIFKIIKQNFILDKDNLGKSKIKF